MIPQSCEVSYMVTNDQVSVILNGHFRPVSLKTERGRKLLAAVGKKPQDFDEIAMLADVALYVSVQTFGRVAVDDRDDIRLDGKVVDYGIAHIILRMLKDGFDVGHLTAFIENVDQNPDKFVAAQVYSFLEVGNMPITPDGCFHAFKRVGDDYCSLAVGKEECTITSAKDNVLFPISKITGRIPHKIGTFVSMDRADCDPNRDKTCSTGLHACSFDYLQSYHGGSGKIVIVKINPRDVTAVPSDYSDTKLRCCRLEVVGEIDPAEAKEHFTKVVDERYTTSAPNDGSEHGIECPDESDLDDGEEDFAFDEFALDPDDGDNFLLEDAFVETCVYTLDEVVALALQDGKEDALEDEKFDCAPDLGDSFFDISKEFESAYKIAYCESYEEWFVLQEPYSKTIFSGGYQDGVQEAALAAFDDEFDCDFTCGARYDHVAHGHCSTYGKGFVLGYLTFWTEQRA